LLRPARGDLRLAIAPNAKGVGFALIGWGLSRGRGHTIVTLKILTLPTASEVGKNANGVGYVGLAYTKAGGIKVMPIDGVLPSIKTVQSKSYPYARPTFYYSNGDPSGVAKEFLDFTISPTGQKIVLQVGFVPIR
jgi:hypothetical protein